MFSQRTTWERRTSGLTEAVARRRKGGETTLDLTASNPTRCGFKYDAPELLAPFADPRALLYEPEPFGLLAAREAVSHYYYNRGAQVDPGHICITSSTSEAYSFLFRLLCDPGDEILIAQPTYPLFDCLADLESVKLVSHALVYDDRWQMLLRSLRARVTAKTRAIIVVHPNNPTGQYVSDRDRTELLAMCCELHLALIVDEVFLDYPLANQRGGERRSFALENSIENSSQPLTFILSGLSKIAALPQMKASWIVASGPARLAGEALDRLELIADAFLSVSAPIQHALPAWLGACGRMQRQISERTRGNLATLDRALGSASAITRLAVEAGWYVILRVPALGSDDRLVEELVEEWGVLVHPGHYYGFDGNGRLVLSLLPPADEFALGVSRILACLVRMADKS